MEGSSGLHITLASERLFTVWGFPITNTILTMWAVMLVLFIVAFFVRQNLSLVPGKLQNFAEWAFEWVYGYVEQVKNRISQLIENGRAARKASQ